MVDGTKNRSAEQWTNADLFFLTDAVACGMPFAEVAGFLNRTESEVRARWKLVARPMPPVGGSRGRRAAEWRISAPENHPQLLRKLFRAGPLNFRRPDEV